MDNTDPSNWQRAVEALRQTPQCPHCGNDRKDLIELDESREQFYCGCCSKTWPMTRTV